MKSSHILALDLLGGHYSLAVGDCTQAAPSRIFTAPAATNTPPPSARLTEYVTDLLSEAGCELSQLRALAVGTGPGPFTAVRSGLAFIQGLAHSLAVPCYAAGSLSVLAQSAFARFSEAQLAVFLLRQQTGAAGKLTLYWSAWRHANGKAVCALPVCLHSSETAASVQSLMAASGSPALLQEIPAPAEKDAVAQKLLDSGRKRRGQILPDGLRQCPAEIVWHFAARRLQQGQPPAALHSVEPEYLPGAVWHTAQEQLRQKMKPASGAAGS